MEKRKRSIGGRALVLAPGGTLLLQFGALTSPTKSTSQASLLKLCSATHDVAGDATEGLLSFNLTVHRKLGMAAPSALPSSVGSASNYRNLAKGA
jgi:hypothetical protein